MKIRVQNMIILMVSFIYLKHMYMAYLHRLATISMPPTAKVLKGHIGFVTSVCPSIHLYVHTVEHFGGIISIKHLVVSFCIIPKTPLSI